MARFIRATHPKAGLQLMRKDLGLGHPDKPGDDDNRLNLLRG
jgi:hypothetical protein